MFVASLVRFPGVFLGTGFSLVLIFDWFGGRGTHGVSRGTLWVLGDTRGISRGTRGVFVDTREISRKTRGVFRDTRGVFSPFIQ